MVYIMLCTRFRLQTQKVAMKIYIKIFKVVGYEQINWKYGIDEYFYCG